MGLAVEGFGSDDEEVGIEGFGWLEEEVDVAVGHGSEGEEDVDEAEGTPVSVDEVDEEGAVALEDDVEMVDGSEAGSAITGDMVLLLLLSSLVAESGAGDGVAGISSMNRNRLKASRPPGGQQENSRGGVRCGTSYVVSGLFSMCPESGETHGATMQLQTESVGIAVLDTTSITWYRAVLDCTLR